LPSEKQLLLFVLKAAWFDPRKGGDLLREAVARVVATLQGKVELLIYGQGSGGAFGHVRFTGWVWYGMIAYLRRRILPPM